MGNSLRAKLIPPWTGCDATGFSDWCKRVALWLGVPSLRCAVPRQLNVEVQAVQAVQAAEAAEAAEAKAMEVCLCVCVSAGAFHFRQSAARNQSRPVPLALLVYLSTCLPSPPCQMVSQQCFFRMLAFCEEHSGLPQQHRYMGHAADMVGLDVALIGTQPDMIRE
jgi:hypothetical protein